MSIPNELAAARLKAAILRPFLASALFALTPIKKEGLGTLAVDKSWRLYFDPKVFSAWSLIELAGVMIHEVSHLIRDHAGRCKKITANHSLFNVASDLEINSGLRSDGITLPSDGMFPNKFEFPENLLAEQYYQLLVKAEEEKQQRQQELQQAQQQESPSPDDSESSDNSSESQYDNSEQPEDSSSGACSDEENGEDKDEEGNGNAQEEGNTDSSAISLPTNSANGDSFDSSSNNSTDSSSLSEIDSSVEDSSSSNSNIDSSPQSSNSSLTSSSNGKGNDESDGEDDGDNDNGEDGSSNEEDNSETNANEEDDKTARPGAGACGSCATGLSEDYEEEEDGLSYSESESIRKEVAKQILAQSKKKNNVPAGWVRWAEEKVRSKVDWRKELRSIITNSMATASGIVDYTYRRPSRRQRNSPQVILPSMYRPKPTLGVVIDTSGSISDPLIAQILGEIEGIIKSQGQKEGLFVVACDSKVQWSGKVYKREQVKPYGGGGTDMRIGINEVLKQKPRPNTVIVITDGLTDWPEKMPLGTKLIVTLLEENNFVPKWAKVVKVKLN